VPARTPSWLGWIQSPALFLPLLLVAALAVASLYVHRNLPIPDEGAILTNAAKILRGAIPYRDIDAYPFPGAYYLLALAMGVFGEHLDVARWLAAAVYCGVVASLYLAAVPLLTRSQAALFGLSLLSFKFLTWPGFSTYLYSDVAFLAACAAIALLLRHRFAGPSMRLVAVGVCTGLALTAKQNVGLYLGAATVALLAFPRLCQVASQSAWRQRIAEVAAYGFGVALTVVPMFAYFAANGLLEPMLYSGFVRPLTGYLPTSGIDFGTMLAWWRLGEFQGRAAAPYLPVDYWHMLMQQQLPGRSFYSLYWLAGEIFSRLVYTSLPASVLWLAFRWRRARRRDLSAQAPSPPEQRLLLFGLPALAVVATAFPRADSFHIFSVYPLLWLLLFALWQPRERPEAGGSPGPRAWGGTRWVAAAVAVLLVISGLLAHSRASYLTKRLQMERADVWVDPAFDSWVEPVVRFVSSEVPEGEPFFVYGHEAHFYFLTGRFFPWPFPQLYPGQAGGDGGEEIGELLRALRPRAIVQGILNWPGVPVVSDYAPALDESVRANFELDRGFFAREYPEGEAPFDWVCSVFRPRPTAPVAAPDAPDAVR
jgi:hypothetical protein